MTYQDSQTPSYGNTRPLATHFKAVGLNLRASAEREELSRAEGVRGEPLEDDRLHSGAGVCAFLSPSLFYLVVMNRLPIEQ